MIGARHLGRGNLAAGLLCLALAAGVAAGGGAGCRSAARDRDPAEDAAPTRALTDALGREVRVPKHPRRIVSLAPAITEILFAAGAGAQVAGVTRFCNHPAEADALPEVGGFADPDVERIARLAPDLVIATADTVTRDRFDALVALGIPAYVTDASDFAGVAASIRGVADAAGHRAEGEALAAAFEARLEAVRARVTGRAPRRVLFLFQADPAIAAGTRTFIDEMLRTAGGENVAASAPTSYPRLGLEGIVALSPEVIVTTMPETAERLRELLEGGPLESRRIVPVDADLVERPGPRLVEGLERVAAILHPDADAAPAASPAAPASSAPRAP